MPRDFLAFCSEQKRTRFLLCISNRKLIKLRLAIFHAFNKETNETSLKLSRVRMVCVERSTLSYFLWLRTLFSSIDPVCSHVTLRVIFNSALPESFSALVWAGSISYTQLESTITTFTQRMEWHVEVGFWWWMRSPSCFAFVIVEQVGFNLGINWKVLYSSEFCQRLCRSVSSRTVVLNNCRVPQNDAVMQKLLKDDTRKKKGASERVGNWTNCYCAMLILAYASSFSPTFLWRWLI